MDEPSKEPEWAVKKVDHRKSKPIPRNSDLCRRCQRLMMMLPFLPKMMIMMAGFETSKETSKTSLLLKKVAKHTLKSPRSPRGANGGTPGRPMVVTPTTQVPTTPRRWLHYCNMIQRPVRYQDTQGLPRPRAMVTKEVPDSYQVVMTSEDSNKWFWAMQDEPESLQRCQT